MRKPCLIHSQGKSAREMARKIGFDYSNFLSTMDERNQDSGLDWSAKQKRELQSILFNLGMPFLSMSLKCVNRKNPLGSGADPGDPPEIQR
jgi:L-ribulose-5-phosphate 3-epimerase UlaE